VVALIVAFNIIVWFLVITVFVGTLLPLTKSVRWWVRAWEFPRLHLALVSLFCLLLVLLSSIAFKAVLATGLIACAVYQGTRIFPYTRLARSEIDIMQGVPVNKQIKLFSANVLMENPRKDDLVGIIDREDPDVLFLMETDQGWLDSVQSCLDRYPTVVTYPLDNHYGLIFATRLTAPSAEVVFLSEDNTPSLLAELLGPDGTGFNFVGLHPRPPVPGNDTALRDRQIKKAAELTGNANWPTVCMGDFNDVAWSWTSKRFKDYGGFFEPRVGRGMYPTFHAQYPIMGVPIDQLYLTAGVGLVSFGRLEEFGSDHYPVSANITLKDMANTHAVEGST